MVRNRMSGAVAIIVAVLAFACACGAAEPLATSAASQPATVASDWPQWRGPNRDGIVANSPRLLDSWPKDGPPQLWKSQFIPGLTLGGMGSPVVAGGKVLLYVNWKHPLEGGEGFHLITTELLSDMGWIPDLPPALAKRLEEAWASPDRPSSAGWGWEQIDWTKYPKYKELDAFLAKTPTLEKYIKDFLDSLAPEEAKKYGDQMKRRLCICLKPEKKYGAIAGLTWDDLVRLSAYREQAYPSYEEWMNCLAKDKIPFPRSVLVPGKDLWEPYAWFRCIKMTDTVICLDAASGKERWKKEYPEDSGVYMESGHLTHIRDGFDHQGASGAATIVDGKCYVAGAMGLYCLSAEDGTLLWHAKTAPTHASPLVVEGVVYHCGSAYDTGNGRLLWKQASWPATRPFEGRVEQFYPALMWSSGGRNYIIGDDGRGATCCLEPKTGNVLWTVKEKGLLGVSGDLLLLVRATYKLSPAGVELLYKTPGRGIDSRGIDVVHEGYRYTVFNKGEFQPVIMNCSELKTGQTKWEGKVTGEHQFSTPVLVDGKIIRHSERAHNVLEHNYIEMIQATPEKYVLMGSFEPKGLCAFTSPAVADGRMYLRLRDGLACYDLRAK